MIEIKKDGDVQYFIDAIKQCNGHDESKGLSEQAQKDINNRIAAIIKDRIVSFTQAERSEFNKFKSSLLEKDITEQSRQLINDVENLFSLEVSDRALGSEDILETIFSFAVDSKKQKHELSLVNVLSSQVVRLLSIQESLFRGLIKNKGPLPIKEVMDHLAILGPRIKTVDFIDDLKSPDDLGQILQLCPNTEVLVLKNFDRNDETFTIIAENCPHLHTLKYEKCDVFNSMDIHVTNAGIEQLVTGCSQIRHLYWEGLKLDNDSLDLISQGYPRLKTLIFGQWMDCNASTLVRLTDRCRELTHLALPMFSPIDFTEDDLITVASHCPSMKILALPCQNYTSDGVVFAVRLLKDLECLKVCLSNGESSRLLLDAQSAIKKLIVFLENQGVEDIEILRALQMSHPDVVVTFASPQEIVSSPMASSDSLWAQGVCAPLAGIIRPKLARQGGRRL